MKVFKTIGIIVGVCLVAVFLGISLTLRQCSNTAKERAAMQQKALEEMAAKANEALENTMTVDKEQAEAKKETSYLYNNLEAEIAAQKGQRYLMQDAWDIVEKMQPDLEQIAADMPELDGVKSAFHELWSYGNESYTSTKEDDARLNSIIDELDSAMTYLFTSYSTLNTYIDAIQKVEALEMAKQHRVKSFMGFYLMDRTERRYPIQHVLDYEQSAKEDINKLFTESRIEHGGTLQGIKVKESDPQKVKILKYEFAKALFRKLQTHLRYLRRWVVPVAEALPVDLANARQMQDMKAQQDAENATTSAVQGHGQGLKMLEGN